MGSLQVTAEALAESDAMGAVRAEAVKDAMKHAWRAYRERAWGYDEIGPKTGEPKASWGGEYPRCVLPASSLRGDVLMCACSWTACVLIRSGM